MSRSVKKGPFIELRLQGRVEEMNRRNEKKVVKTWSRASVIFPTFIGPTIAVYNGNKHVPVYVTENLSAEDLIVADAQANEGPTIKRWRPRAQGRAFPIHKPMTHITIVVADREA